MNSKVNHDYKEGVFYEKNLCLVKRFGNARERYVILKDENNVLFTWKTSDRNMNSLIIPKRIFVKIRFKVKSVFTDYSGKTTIWIGYAKRI